MSFSVSIPATKKTEFIDTASGLDIPTTVTTPEGEALFNEARRAAIDLAASLTGESEYVTASISGHAYTGEENSYSKNSVNVSVSETDAPPEPAAA